MASPLGTGKSPATSGTGPGATVSTGRLNWTADGQLLPQIRTEPIHWPDDLDWHRGVYKDAKFRWQAIDALRTATDFTHGHHDFRTVGDLRRLAGYRLDLASYTTTCQRAFGRAIKQVRSGLKLPDWDGVGQLLRMDPIECAQSSFFATWADPRDPSRLTNPQVERVTLMCGRFAFASPLLLAWELKQVWRMCQAAEGILEDTLVDLVVELRGTVREDDLVRSSGMMTSAGLWDRVDTQRRDHGEAGDPRREPHQVF
ncbi:hypothetical protein AB0N05_37795 [Nocardia sp. NPDC051030]|uniref:hypothetical protein n=1 Tax=Nocardia sp. NPDC051030 TaxID=3155162 RepID=UPI0034120B5D